MLACAHTCVFVHCLYGWVLWECLCVWSVCLCVRQEQAINSCEERVCLSSDGVMPITAIIFYWFVWLLGTKREQKIKDVKKYGRVGGVPKKRDKVAETVQCTLYRAAYQSRKEKDLSRTHLHAGCNRLTLLYREKIVRLMKYSSWFRKGLFRNRNSAERFVTKREKLVIKNIQTKDLPSNSHE